MPINNDDRVAGPFTSGSTFPFDFKVFQATDVKVVEKSALGVETVLAYPSAFTVSLNPDQDVAPGGSITRVAGAISGGVTITVTSAISYTQPVTLTNGGAFFPIVITNALDRVTIGEQQLASDIDRSVKFPLSDGQDLTTTLPTAANRLGRALVFDATTGAVGVSTRAYDDQGAVEAAASAAAAAISAASADADATTAAADAASADADATATAADRVQTGLDRVATAADRVQTGLDRTAAAASATDAALVDTAGVALLTKRTQGITELTRAPNCWSDQVTDYMVYTGLYGGQQIGGLIAGKNTNAVATISEANGRKSVAFTSSDAFGASHSIIVPIAFFGGVQGGKCSFSSRVTARVGSTAGTEIYIEQRATSGGALIATTNYTIPVPAAAALPPDGSLQQAAMPIHATANFIYIRFTSANSSNSFTLTDILLAAGSVADFRPADAKATTNAGAINGLQHIFKGPNLFRDADYAIWASAPTATLASYDGTRVVKGAIVTGTVITTPAGNKGVRFSNTGVSNTRWMRDISRIGLVAGDTVSAAMLMNNVTNIMGAASDNFIGLTVDQRDAAFAQIAGTNETIYTSGQQIEQLAPFQPKTVAVNCKYISITPQFSAANMSLDLSCITIGKGSVANVRPDWHSEVTSRVMQVLNRNARGFAFLGDSRMAAAFEDGGQKVKTAKHFFNQANAHPSMAQRMQVLYTGATSGFRSDQFLTYDTVSAALNSGAKWCIIWGAVNDIAQGVTGDQVWLGGYSGSLGVKNAADYLISQGMNVILVTEPGANNFGTSTTSLGAKNKYNRYLREYCEVTAGAYLFDIEAVVLDPTLNQPTWKASYSADGIHPGNLGGYYAGMAFKDLMLPLVPALPAQQFTNSAQIYANGNIDQLTNALFTTTTGGTNNTAGGITGSVPSGWTLSKSGTVTGTITTTANADGFGNDVVLALNFTNTQDFVRLQQNPTAAQIPLNSIAECGVETTVDSGSVNFGGVYILAEATLDTAGVVINRNVQSLYSHQNGKGPDNCTQVQKTPKLSFAGLSTVDSATFKIDIRPASLDAVSNAQTASATVRVRRPFYRMRNS